MPCTPVNNIWPAWCHHTWSSGMHSGILSTALIRRCLEFPFYEHNVSLFNMWSPQGWNSLIDKLHNFNGSSVLNPPFSLSAFHYMDPISPEFKLQIQFSLPCVTPQLFLCGVYPAPAYSKTNCIKMGNCSASIHFSTPHIIQIQNAYHINDRKNVLLPIIKNETRFQSSFAVGMQTTAVRGVVQYYLSK